MTYFIDGEEVEKSAIKDQFLLNILNEIVKKNEDGANIVNLALLNKAFFSCRDEALSDTQLATVSSFFYQFANVAFGESDLEVGDFGFFNLRRGCAKVLSCVNDNYYKVNEDVIKDFEYARIPQELQGINDILVTNTSAKYDY